MATRAAWWLAAACALSITCGKALGYDATWPGCSRSKGSTTMEVVEPGQTNSSVTGIHLADCNLTTINLDSLKTYLNLKVIYLKDIKVVNITGRTFDYFPNLERLTMRNNLILGKNLPSNLFHNCHRLNFIEFTDNNMSGAPADLLQGLDQLRTLFLHHCSLREVPSFFTSQVFPNMDYFQGYYDDISKLKDPETFANAVNLNSLSLTYNRIDYLHDNLLKPLTKIKTIWLSGNKLRYIPEPMFQNQSALRFIDLAHNMIEYVPINAFLGTNLKELKLNNNRLTYLPQNFFSNLHTTGVNLVRLDFFGNPFECACLNKILVRIKKLKIDYDRSEYDGRHQACMIAKPSLIIDHNNGEC